MLFVWTNGQKAVFGLLWDINAGQLGLLKDKVYCATLSNKCSVNRYTLAQNFGVYDYYNAFLDSDKFAFDHYFYNWNEDSLSEKLKSDFNNSESKNRWVLLTIEPFPLEESTDLLQEIADHRYDSNIETVCKTINNSKNAVFVRWGHEMENVTGRYPWAVTDASKFIAAYNHFVSTCKQHTPNAYYVWSPVGDKKAIDYYPSAFNVDYVGVSLYVHPDFEQDYYKRIRSFTEIFGEKYKWIKKLEKPVIIAELGIINDPFLQKYWWYNASKNFDKFPLLKSIIYFNAIDTEGVWGEYKRPDWKISESNLF